MIALENALSYCPLTGKLYWLEGTRNAGKEAGSLHKATGYMAIRFGGKFLYAHRIAWYLSYGYWPIYIDHTNRIRNDNRLQNLTDVSKRENHLNMKRFSNNTSGITGVFWSKEINKWVASITINSKQQYLGCFDEKAIATQTRKNAEIAYGFHSNHGT